MRGRPKIVLLGMLTKMPVGGVAWLVVQYAVGFERLGFDVYYVEAHARTPSMFVADEGDDGTEAAAGYLARLMERFGLGDRWVFHALHADGRCVGASHAQLQRLYRDAALIVNLHGGTVPLPEHAATGRLVLLGTDPVELELELERGDQRALDFVAAHAARFTWGLNYGNPDCGLPWASDHPFVPSAPPVVLDFWTTGESFEDGRFTTIGNWRQHWREVTFRGESYSWSKHHEFLKILDLPRRVPVELELALSNYDDADRRLLEEYGWHVRSGLEVSSEIDSYRDYILRSRGELTAAKDQNIRFRTGWFSERSAAYLAAGRPVIMQDTGFGNALPIGEGLLPFTDVEEASAAVEAVAVDDKRHRRAAADIAREFLSHDVVLGTLLDHVGIDVASRRRQTPDSVVVTPLAPAALPPWLRLTPQSRRPLVLAVETERYLAGRPVPMVPIPDARHPAASVVVVVLDNLAVTRMALESVLANTAESVYELIVVDNGSTDPTRQYLSVLAARNACVRLIRNECNRGFAAGVNAALALARGDVLVVLNNDTVATPGWLAGLHRHLNDRAVGLVGPTTNRCGSEAEISSDYDTYGELLAFAAERDTSRLPVDVRMATLFCAALRRDVLSVVGLLDERFGLGLFEDDDYSHRVRAAGLRVVCAPDVFVHHFGEATIGALVPGGDYGRLFDANRRRFEAKWGEPWAGHGRRADPVYDAIVERVQRAISTYADTGSTVLVVSKGDDDLVALADRTGWHFPRLTDGTYAGHHPADDEDAIDQLERSRTRGARYFVVPPTAAWWLTHYTGFAGHLDARYRRATPEWETTVIYRLDAEVGG